MVTTQSASKLFYNGIILTMNDEKKTVEAVAVQGDSILACGNFDELKMLSTEKTEYVDLQGKTMLPGFIDSHSHIFGVTRRVLWVNLNSVPLGVVRGMEDIVSLLQKKAAETPAGEWVIGWGYDDSKIKENRHPTIIDLDKVSTKHPVAIIHISGWVTVSNSYALRKCNVDKNFQNTSNCVVERDADNNPTGVIKAASCPVMAHFPTVSDEDFKKSLILASEQYLAKGCTTAQDGWWANQNYLKLTQEAIETNKVNLRFVLYPVGEGEMSEIQKNSYTQHISGEYLDDKKMICMGAMKITMDGSLQAYTGYLSEPYYICPEDKPNHCGSPNYTQEWLDERLLEFHKKGKQVAIHCNGDGAIEMAINAMEYVQKVAYREDARFIFIHCQTVRTDQLQRIAKLRGTISFFVTHTYFWGERHYHRFLGKERALRLDPVQEALDLGINVTLHNDTHVTPIDPLLLVWSAVNRQSYEGNDMGKKEQGCSVEDALKTITVNAAIQGFEEGEKGTIEAGKLADFTILAENPLAVDPMHIKDIQVVATIVGGKTAFGSL